MRLFRYVLLLTFLSPALAWAQSTATYRVTFESAWSAETHPDGFPPNPHFSDLTGATHDGTATLWSAGSLASPGTESMAETGSTSPLASEVQALIGEGKARAVLSGGGIGNSPGEVSMTFEVTEDYPLVSLVSMLAPSPDWFVGVDGLSLWAVGTWVTQRREDLYVYDAGTDSGETYTAPNQDTNPAETITQIEGAPFFVHGQLEPVGTFTFTLLGATDSESAAPVAAFALDAPAPNPASSRSAFQLHLDRPQPVRVDVFDVLGRRVSTLYEGMLPAGVHPFALDVRRLPAGLYVVRARGAEAQVTRRLIVQQR